MNCFVFVCRELHMYAYFFFNISYHSIRATCFLMWNFFFRVKIRPPFPRYLAGARFLFENRIRLDLGFEGRGGGVRPTESQTPRLQYLTLIPTSKAKTLCSKTGETCCFWLYALPLFYRSDTWKTRVIFQIIIYLLL